MIRFTCRHRKRDGTPVVTDQYVTEYAEALLAEYKPELLKTPGQIDGLHFLEAYLGADIDFMYLFYPGDGQIAGATVFNDDVVLVDDPLDDRIRRVPVKADTIIIDERTMQKGKEGFALFTQLHEGGHLSMHPAVFRRGTDDQITLFETNREAMAGVAKQTGSVMCMRSMVEGSRKKKLETQEDFREHQASVFAAALAMPRRPFEMVVKQLAREKDLSDKLTDVIVEYDDADLGFALKRMSLIDEVSKIFGVSCAAAEVQMRKRGLLMTDEEYSNRHNTLLSRAF